MPRVSPPPLRPFGPPPDAPVPRRNGLLLVACLLGIAGCATLQAGSSGNDLFDRSDPTGQVVLEIRNQLEEEVTVRVQSGSQRSEVGTVPPRGFVRLAIPWGSGERATFQVEPLTGGRYSFPPVDLHPGDSMELTIETPLSRSTLRR